MATLLQFSKNMRSLGSRIENNSAVLTRRVAKRALKSLVLGTPADKGVARSNWRVSIGGEPTAIIPAYAPGKKLGIGERANARAAIAAGNAAISRLRTGPVTGRAGKSIKIGNSIPYLQKLRNGSSAQQPNDWVDSALIEAKSEIGFTRLVERDLIG